MSEAKEIWIAGGYGDVGLKTARYLLAMQDRPVVLAGRDGDRATEAAATLGNRARGAVLDMRDTAPHAALAEAAALVNMIEPVAPVHAEKIMRAGGMFVDISASADHLDRLAAHLGGHNLPGLGVLFAGLAPGMTNIAARHLAETVTGVREIELCVTFGLGEHQGAAALQWFIENLDQSYECIIDGNGTTLAPGAATRLFPAPDRGGSRLGIGVGFADQLAIARTNDLTTARTFVALDPGWTTRMLLLSLRAGLARYAAPKADGLARLLSRGPTLGQSGSVLNARGLDGNGTLAGELALVMPAQAEATAVLTALTTIEALNAGKSGLVNADDIVSYETAIEALAGQLPSTRVFEREGPPAHSTDRSEPEWRERPIGSGAE